MISQETIQRLHSVIDIEEIIGSFITLKKKGTRYWACCPFHSEKTPSFCVNNESATYKCFGCGESGDAISFLQKIENYSFSEAVRYLANLYKVDLEELTKKTDQEESFNETIYIINELINKFYIENLDIEIKNKSKVYEYLLKRNLDLDYIKDFKIGFSSTQNPIVHKLKKLGYSNEMIMKTGGFIDYKGTIEDRFSNRLIFPIDNYSSKICAFAGRIIENSNQAKYINSPENEIFKKRKILYGISQAKQTIKKNNKCYLVEGYTDVIAFHLCGIKNTISCMGTSLTTEQINAIKRYTDTVVLTFDADSAGINASLKGIDLLLASNLQVNVISLPKTYDPHSFFMKYGKDYFYNFINNNEIDFLDFKINLLSQTKTNDLSKKSQCINDIIKSLTLINDKVYRLLLIKKCSSFFKIPENIIFEELKKYTSYQNKIHINKNENIKKNSNNIKIADNNDLSRKSIEREIFKILLKCFEKRTIHNEIINFSTVQEFCDINFSDEKYLEILNLLKSNQGTNCTIKELISKTNNETKNLIIDLMYDKNEISKKWKIDVLEKSDQNVNKLLNKNLLKLKLSLIRILIDENMEKLKNNQNTSFAYENIIDNHKNLKKTEKEFLQKLKTIS